MTDPCARTLAGSNVAMTVLAALLEARTGQQLASYRSWRLDTALKPLLRERGLETLDQLVVQLLDGQDRTVADRIVDALVNCETSFYRDQPVFEMLAEAIATHEDRGRRVRIWSAGCATGQEPLSLAMHYAERQADTRAPVPEIVATDVSDSALARARAGRYTQFEIQRGLPIRRMMRWFDGDGGDWVAKAELVRMIQFRRMNLVSDRPPPGKFDVVLCRNVLIYFSADHVTRIVRALGERLNPQGWLLIGHAEPNPTFGQWLQPVALPGTVAYRPIDTPASQPPPVLVPALPDLAPILFAPPPEPVAAAAPARPLPTPRPVAPAIEHPLSPGDLLAEIRVLADAGETARAWRRLHEEIDGYATDPPLRYYEGLLALDLGREREAERALRGALFLDRAFVMAHFQLGLLLARVGRRGEAARALDNALRLAQGLPPETILPEGDGVSAARLAESARRALAGITGRDA